MSPSGPSPSLIRVLSQHECIALLTRNHVGRLAFAFHGRVDIRPLHYVFEGGWIYGRTSDGPKLVSLAHRQWVAFEVDEVRDTFDWASVVVHGSFHRLELDGNGRELMVASHTVSLLRVIIPETFTADDPVPSRRVLFRLAVGDMTGRAARPSASSSEP